MTPRSFKWSLITYVLAVVLFWIYLRYIELPEMWGMYLASRAAVLIPSVPQPLILHDSRHTDIWIKMDGRDTRVWSHSPDSEDEFPIACFINELRSNPTKEE